MVRLYDPSVWSLIALMVAVIVWLIVSIVRHTTPWFARLAVVLLAAFSMAAHIQSGVGNELLTIDKYVPNEWPYTATANASTPPMSDAYAGGGAMRILPVTLESAVLVQRALQSMRTYSCSASFTPDAAANRDLFGVITNISSSAMGVAVVRVVSVKLTTTNTAAGSQQYSLIKRSAIDIGSGMIFIPGVPLDEGSRISSATLPAQASCEYYPSGSSQGLGGLVGTMSTVRWASPAAVPASFATVVEDAGKEFLSWNMESQLDKAIVLRPSQESLFVFNPNAGVAGVTHTFRIVWTESIY